MRTLKEKYFEISLKNKNNFEKTPEVTEGFRFIT
jgi:hypothetical protein